MGSAGIPPIVPASAILRYHRRLDGHGSDGSAPTGGIFQAQAIENGTGEADGKTVTGTDGVDDMVDVIARHAIFLAVGRADIGPMTAAHFDDDGLNAALQIITGNISFIYPSPSGSGLH